MGTSVAEIALVCFIVNCLHVAIIRNYPAWTIATLCRRHHRFSCKPLSRLSVHLMYWSMMPHSPWVLCNGRHCCIAASSRHPSRLRQSPASSGPSVVCTAPGWPPAFQLHPASLIWWQYSPPAAGTMYAWDACPVRIHTYMHTCKPASVKWCQKVQDNCLHYTHTHNALHMRTCLRCLHSGDCTCRHVLDAYTVVIAHADMS